MSDLLSSLASVLAIAGSATESIKALTRFFRQFRNAPVQVHQWLTMLESLRSTLSSLQQYGRNLDPRYQFSSHFQQRLLSCVIQLQICASEVARIDAELQTANSDGKNKWDHKARRSWQRAKWAIVGDHKMKKVMETLNLYHFEFVMELLKVLISIERTVAPPPDTPAVAGISPLQQQQPTGSGDQPEVPPQRLLQTASNVNSNRLECTGTIVGANACGTSLPAALEYNCPEPGFATTAPVIWSHQSVKPAVSFRWSIWACRFMVRAGPVTELRSGQSRKAHNERYRKIGYNLICSFYLPQQFRKVLGLALCNFQMMVTNRTRNTLHWSLDFPMIVSPNAEIFESARAGLTEKVKCLLSLRKASPKDTTVFGTTLLHSASKSGNMELVRLLIQEGADVNAQDEDGESPLHGAMARGDNYNVARILIENGADLSGQAVDGKTPLHNIFNNTISHILMRDDWLENTLPDSEAMSITHYLAWSSKSTLEIFQRGHLYDDVDMLSADKLGRTCLHFAASRGNLEVLSYLIRQVSLEDVEKKDIQGRRPLHYAAESSRASGVIDILVDRGCNILAMDDLERTAFHWAARWNNYEAAKKLIAMVGGNTLLLSDKNGRTPSQQVCQRRAPALWKFLADLESSSGVCPEQFNVTRHRRGPASHSAGWGFSLVLNIVGILALIFMMLAGSPD